jgi:8-oxo-dGTP pyrophosphatase MutT (NUDIX family)
VRSTAFIRQLLVLLVILIHNLSMSISIRRMSYILSHVEMDKLVRYTHQWNMQHANSAQAFTRCKWVSKAGVLGYIAPYLLPHLHTYHDIFTVDKDSNTIAFTTPVQTLPPSERTEVLHEINCKLRDRGVIHGWRNEMFPVVTSFGAEPELLIERAACAPYGTKAYGCHINGYIRDPSSRDITHMWVGKRSASKPTYPSMLDHIVAGGLPHGVSVTANVIKECMEEASIPEALAATARSVGVVTNSYIDHEDNYKRDVLFCFDLELPPDFVPVPQDGEVECFRLHSIEEVLEIVLRGGPHGYKPNCTLVVIDFFIR